jgi:hypothetical protein
LALGGGSRVPAWHSPLIWGAAILLAVAALQKYTTATSAVLALAIVLVVSPWRAWKVACWTAVLTVALFGLTMLHQHERMWFTQLPRLQPTGAVRWDDFGLFTWRVSWVNPILLLWPAASLYGYAASRRRVWLFGPLLAVLLALAGVVFQQRFYPYHYGALPVLFAGLVALAAALWWQRTGRIPYAVVLVAAVWIPVAAWMGRQPWRWRLEHSASALTGVLATFVLAGIIAGGQAWRARGSVTHRSVWKLLPLAAALALIISFPDWPRTPNTFNWQNTNRESQLSRRVAMIRTAEPVRAAADGAPVVYVTQQEAPYFVGLPATCSYPLAVFLYRSVGAKAGDLTGFRENLDCIRDPAARYLVLQESAAARGRALPIVRTTIEQQFDCQHPAARTKTYTLCPRR